MNEPLTLTNKTLERLRHIADGNGLEPNDIHLIESEEKDYVIEGKIRLEPQCDIEPRHYFGPVKGKDRRVLPHFAAMSEEVNRQKENFLKSKSWLAPVIKELQNEPGHGWGLQDGKIPLPDLTCVLAATENCPACGNAGGLTCTQCQGQTVVICPHCRGQGQEECYNCFGRGEDPVNPQKPCPICLGTRFAPCRYCKSTGKLPCPSCQGRGNTTCKECKGTGRITQEVAINCHAKIHFQILSASSLPSGLLRSMDRLGMAKLPKGHADISLQFPENPEEEKPQDALSIQAHLPYADIKVRLKNKAFQIAAFGKRGLLSGIPPFLDESLKPWLEHLEQAALGGPGLDAAIESRLIRDALKLELDGKRQANDLRRLYPVGLSPKTAQSIMRRMEQALRRKTLRTRVAAAVLCFLASSLVFAGLFFTPLHDEIAKAVSPSLLMAIDVLVPAAAAGFCRIVIIRSARWALQRHYPGIPVKMSQKIGKMGYGVLGAVLAVYGLFYAFASGKIAF